MVIYKIWKGIPKEVKQLETTKRGEKGFGSTGQNVVIMKKEITEVKHEQQKTDKHGYKFGERTTDKQKNTIRNLMKEFKDILATSFEEIRVFTPKYFYDIDTRDHPPIR